jgi:hypothetical protein
MPPPHFPGVEGLGFRRWMIAVVACLFAVWAGVTLADSPYLVFAGLAGLIYVGTLAVNAKALAWLVIALQPAALIVPFFPGRPFWWELCALLAWPSLLVYFLVNRQRLSELKFDRLERGALLALVGYVGVLVFLMMYRGVGFRSFGGGQMGGRVYAQQLVLSILPPLMLVVQNSRRQLLSAVILGWLLTLTYLLAELSFSGGGGVMKTILYFIELPVDGLNFEVGYSMTGVRRYGSFASVAFGGLSCLWVLCSLRDLFGRWAWAAVPAMLGLFFLGLGSGYRNMLIIPVITFGFLTLFQRFWTPVRIIGAFAVVAVIVGALYITAAKLPLPVQRSVSFLPGIEISQIARIDAATTNTDRLEVMKMALGDIPKYWLVGRGFGMDRLDQAPIDSSTAGATLLYEQGMFYNGVFGSALKTGLPGLVCMLAFSWFGSRLAVELIRLVRRRSINEQGLFDRLCLVLCAQWFAFLVHFYLTNGDVNIWMQTFGISAALIMICRHRQQQDESTNPVGVI